MNAQWNDNPGKFPLTLSEEAICLTLLKAKGRILSYETLGRAIYGCIDADWPDDWKKCLVVFICRARKKIGPDYVIHTRSGQGYWMEYIGCTKYPVYQSMGVPYGALALPG